ncbi:MAG: endonuclease MutS2 [Gemmatimonadales bacterium]
MTEAGESNSPDGVLVSSDAGTPFALPGEYSADALTTLEFDAVLSVVATHATGPLGAASLRARRPSGDLSWIRDELAQVAEVVALVPDRREPLPEPVPDIAAPLGRLRIGGSVLEGTELALLQRAVVAARLVAAGLRRVAEDAPRTLRLARPVPERALERRLELAVDAEGRLLDTASPALAAARSDVRSARDRLVRKLEAVLRGVESGSQGAVTVRNGRYVIPVPRDARGRPHGIVHDESASGGTLFLEPTETIELGNALRAAEAKEEREALRVCRELTELLRPQSELIGEAHAMCVAVDDLVARARYTVQVGGHAPELAPAPAALVITQARHPLLLTGAEPGAVVPFDLELGPEERTVLLSGPNTGGKTVLLKAVGLAAALSQSGVIPPVGPGTRLPLFRRFYADIGDRQSIAASLSTFSAHVAALRRVLDEADPATLVLLDEIGGGTDPAEGGALASAALLSLTRRGSITIATTHLGALKQLAAHSTGIVNASLQFDAASLRPTYRLLKGIPGRSYGLAIARRLGIAADVLAEAESQVPDAERSLDALLAAVEQRERELLARDRAQAERAIELESAQARLAAQEESQTAREAVLRTKERESERTARASAKAYLLEARQRVEQAIAMARAAVDEVTAREARRLVEEGVQAEAEALAEAEAAASGPAAPAEGVVGVGSRVRLQGGGSGQVVELRADGRLVVAAGAVRLVVSPDQAVPVHATAPVTSPSPVRFASPAAFEIDLRGLTGDEAEPAVVAALDAAVLAGNPFLRIIHGKGTGVVRDRVRQVVAGDRRVARSGFAPPNQGGTGVTIVEFAE